MHPPDSPMKPPKKETRLSQITISKGFKFSKNWNSTDVNVSLTYEVGDNEDLDKLVEYVSDAVADIVEGEINKQIILKEKLEKEKRY